MPAKRKPAKRDRETGCASSYATDLDRRPANYVSPATLGLSDKLCQKRGSSPTASSAWPSAARSARSWR